MSILASLARVYERAVKRGELPPFGFAKQNIHFCLVLNRDGKLQGPPVSWGGDRKGAPLPKLLAVPYYGGRSGSDAPPYFLWDNSAYVLGISKKENFDATRRFESFKALCFKSFGDSKDEGLAAVLRFLSSWQPANATSLGFEESILDRNIVFRLGAEGGFVHERPAAIEAWTKVFEPDTLGEGVCLVSGKRDRIARIHPPIKSFENPARIVSFDKDSDAFASYGHVQAENAPTGIEAAFAYTAALNSFLERDSGHRIQIGDASTVFWAEASTPELAEEAESFVSEWLNPSPANEEAIAAKEIAGKLKKIRAGVSLREIEPDLENVRFYVLGLAPNAARLSIRFYFEDSFGVLTQNYQRYLQDMRFEPWPLGRKLSIASMVLRTAPARTDNKQVKFDRGQISPLLSGELLRAILTGSRFPGSLLSLLLLRVRSDHVLDSVRISLIKGLIVRGMRLDGRLPTNSDGTFKEDYLVRSDPDDLNDARRLGRLFALIERAQLTALGDDLSATVKDKFLSAAAATPRHVFTGLLENAENHHLKRLRNGHSDARWIADSAQKSGRSIAQVARSVGAAINADIGRLAATFKDGFPERHTIQDQGLFLVGYYQERYGRKKDVADGPDDDDVVESNSNGEGGE